jgi:hypothetical protein
MNGCFPNLCFRATILAAVTSARASPRFEKCLCIVFFSPLHRIGTFLNKKADGQSFFSTATSHLAQLYGFFSDYKHVTGGWPDRGLPNKAGNSLQR